MTQNNFYSLLERMTPYMKGTEQRLAAYLKENAQRATHMTIRDLARAADVSPSAVVRFVHALGFEHYQHMIVSIARSQHADVRSQSGADAPDGDDAQEESIVRYAARLEETLAQTVHQSIALLLEEDCVSRAMAMMNDARMIYLYGVGSSGVIAQELLQKLLALGKPCFFQSDSYLSSVSAQNVGPGDVVVGISYSGRNQAVCAAVESAKKQGASAICITRAGSRLARLADVCLRLPPVPQLGSKGENLSRYAQSVVLDLLFYEGQKAQMDAGGGGGSL